jgi:octopine/nopaline transport system permease protein
MIKATSLASIITLTVEIFIVTGAIYLALTFLMSTAFALAERQLHAHHAHRRA